MSNLKLLLLKDNKLNPYQNINSNINPRTTSPNINGRISALVISNNYPGKKLFQLDGCWNDAELFIKRIQTTIDPNANIVWMKDDDNIGGGPTKNPLFANGANIVTQMNIWAKSPQNILFLYLAGHGGTDEDKINFEKSLTSIHFILFLVVCRIFLTNSEK